MRYRVVAATRTSLHPVEVCGAILMGAVVASVVLSWLL